MQSFEVALRENLAAQPKQRRRAKRLLEILNDRPSRRRTRILERLEMHARVELDFDGDDWAEVNWPSVLKTILDLLLRLLPLFLV